MNIRRCFAAAALAIACAGSMGTASAAGYSTQGRCAGLPRVSLTVPAGWCVALVADASSGLRFPRRVLEISPGRYWLADMGSWEPGRGRILEFSLPAAGAKAPIALKVVAEKLDRPHGLALGPDGLVYIGEASRVVRTPGTGVFAPEVVLKDLPADGAHPLKEIVFGVGGQLFVNVGSASDACRDDAGQQAIPCPQVVGPKRRAAVYEAQLSGAGNAVQSFVPYATGLRNSVALAWVASPGVLLQGENSVDYADEAEPPEELNVLSKGSDYGWPYCVGAKQPARGYEGRFDCAKTTAPAMLWPAHVAPLQMIAVPASAKNAFAGQLLVAWHGYRAAGHRVVSYVLDAMGRPSGEPRLWIAEWNAATGVRPLGAPTGIHVDSFGRMFVVEDRNKTLLMLVRERP